MNFVHTIKEALLQLAYPHICIACGTDVLDSPKSLCLQCHQKLPRTFFETTTQNPVEKLFIGRLTISQACAIYFYSEKSTLQKLMHELKYNGNQEVGLQIGRQMGEYLMQSNLYNSVQALIPLPLHKEKQKIRGYNQAELLCKGIAEKLQLPVINNVTKRLLNTESQTKKNREERWQNMQGKFGIENGEKIAGKHILLVDDVVTTGATLEWCGNQILQTPGTTLSIATLCFANK